MAVVAKAIAQSDHTITGARLPATALRMAIEARISKPIVVGSCVVIAKDTEATEVITVDAITEGTMGVGSNGNRSQFSVCTPITKRKNAVTVLGRGIFVSLWNCDAVART